MTNSPSSPSRRASSPSESLRLWPGIVLLALQWLGRFVVPIAFPDALPYGVMGALGFGLAIAVWWAFFSKAPRLERWGGVLVMIAGLAVTPYLLHESIRTGAMGMLFFIYVVPVLSLALVAWAVMRHRFPVNLRPLAMVAILLLACGGWALIRTGGFTGGIDSDFAWRWAKTPEERLLALGGNESAGKSAAVSAALTDGGDGPSWPGFRGSLRNSVISGVEIATDWATSPPKELWRRPIGPGWSSFAVQGDLFYTQEQRGEEEVVSCYHGGTGDLVWKHSDPARFWESNGGAGPRGTPTLHGGLVFSFGATGILNALDAGNGALLWSRDAASDTKAKLPTWGFAGSPLVVDDLVIIAASGSLIAYDLASGEPRWSGPAGGAGYSSPHFLTLEGVPQVLQIHGGGVISVSPTDGSLLWEHAWPGYPIVQPALTAEGDLLVSASSSSGLRRLAVSRSADGWNLEERWTSIRLKPYSSDFVVHKGHAYGFDGSILACIELENGERKWKGGRYGLGQLVLLEDQDLLLVLTEKGELALVEATPEGFGELVRIPMIEGKTWNHPVLLEDRLLIRNGQEMVALQLPLTKLAVASVR
ncbi:MAG: PQQ-like beta-propeller repeat protein [Deltaproteobacteria bacterium]|nr:PQQ-like beta-propeller repeat protein [Deltaproteobacteria bacterium]